MQINNQVINAATVYISDKMTFINKASAYKRASEISKHKNDIKQIKIGIITALPEEYTAMEALLENVMPDNILTARMAAGNRYTIGEINSLDGGMHRIALTLLPGMGNNYAAAVATKMQNLYPNIEAIIVTGIAGGVPSSVRLGDIVISTKGVIQYDFGKEEQDKFTPRENGSACSTFLLEAVSFLKATELKKGASWRKYIKLVNEKVVGDYARPRDAKEQYYTKIGTKYSIVEREASAQTELYMDKIASGNAVQRNPERRDLLNRDYQIIAIEMESSGINTSTKLEGNGYIAVRGICDFCDGTKNDRWHNYAAAVAAAYTRALIESIPTVAR